MEMEMEQEMEWLEAQEISVSVNLLAAAKRQLEFLAAVDRNRWLYEGPSLQKAVYRYNACWLPLLAKHSESRVLEGPLIVPLDCEWVWHCHRLNPVRYKSDCEMLYGKILDNSDVASSVQGPCVRETEEFWNRLYPEEPYKFDLAIALSEDVSEKMDGLDKCTTYDLVSSVKRQIPFSYQVSRPHMNNDIFIREAITRYKGFLHLIRWNRQRSIDLFCVPTYEIDLIWHTHQLHPISYCKDLTEVLGKVLQHDDTDSDRTKGMKLDVGFSGTTKQWEATFGRRYWKAGAMYRGTAPSPLKGTQNLSTVTNKEIVASSERKKIVQLPELKFVEVFLEIVGVKNLPEGHKGSLLVSFSKTQPDLFFSAKQKLSILSESAEKQVASFRCEPSGELLFELMSHSPSNLPMSKTLKSMGSTSLSLQDFLSPVSKLSFEKWLDLVPSSGIASVEPICLRVAVSFTSPSPAPHVFHMIRPRVLSKSSCFLPLPVKEGHTKRSTRVIHEAGTELINLQLRDNGKTRDNCIAEKEVIGTTKSGETHTLAEYVGTGWSLMDSVWSLQKRNEDGYVFDLTGNRMVSFFLGKKLEYEHNHFEKRGHEQDFMTAVEFSEEYPYGKAVALVNLKDGVVKINEDWFVLPGITSAFILSSIWKKKGFGAFSICGVTVKKTDKVIDEHS